MTNNSAMFLLLTCFRLSAVVFVVFVAAFPSYAQPANSVIVERLGAQILRGPGSQIGVSTRDRTPPETRDAAGFWNRWFLTPNGIVIEHVRGDSPAARAGLMKGDIVTEFDGQRVLNANQFSRLVEETPPGWTVEISIVRDGKARKIPITPTL